MAPVYVLRYALTPLTYGGGRRGPGGGVSVRVFVNISRPPDNISTLGSVSDKLSRVRKKCVCGTEGV